MPPFAGISGITRVNLHCSLNALDAERRRFIPGFLPGIGTPQGLQNEPKLPFIYTEIALWNSRKPRSEGWQAKAPALPFRMAHRWGTRDVMEAGGARKRLIDHEVVGMWIFESWCNLCRNVNHFRERARCWRSPSPRRVLCNGLLAASRRYFDCISM
jgi:hypothetical protein